MSLCEVPGGFRCVFIHSKSILLVELLDLFLCVLPTRLPVHTYAFVIYVGPSKREESKALGFNSEFLQFLPSKRDAYYS